MMIKLQLQKKWEAHGTVMIVMALLLSVFYLFYPLASLAAETVATSCARNMGGATGKPGQDIINAVFANIDALLKYIGMSMYNKIIMSGTFLGIVITSVSLYVAFYGVMIMLNLVSHRPSEVFGRLIRIGIIYTLLTPIPPFSGWIMFDQYIGRLFMGGMNQLINFFTTAAYLGSAAIPIALPTSSFAYLDPAALSAFYPAMNVIFQPYFIISILGMMLLGTSGPILAVLMIWGFISFILLMLNAMVTYVRGVIGLSFMFGIAPIFIAFLLFQRTRNIFFGWLNQVLAFALTPVMMFAFLAFYGGLIGNVLTSMFQGVDFCFTSFMTIPGTPVDIGWWRPAIYENGKWNLISGDWVNMNGTERNPAINIVNIVFFLMISHIGLQFSKHIEKLAEAITGGIAESSIGGSELGTWMSNSGNQLGGALSPGRTGRKSKSGSGGGSAGGGGGTPPSVPRPAVTTPPFNPYPNRPAVTTPPFNPDPREKSPFST